MNLKKLRGDWGEAVVADYLRNRGYEIAAVQFRCRMGEIDLIARDGDSYLFCECKWRAQPAGLLVLEALVRKSGLFRTKTSYYAIFSKSGFAPELIEAAERNGNVFLYSLKDLME